MCDENLAKAEEKNDVEYKLAIKAEAKWHQNKDRILSELKDLSGEEVDESLQFILMIAYVAGYADASLNNTKVTRKIIA